MRRSYFEHVQLKAGCNAWHSCGHDGYEMQMDAATDSVDHFSSDFLEELTDRIKCEASEFYDIASLKVVISNLVIDYAGYRPTACPCTTSSKACVLFRCVGPTLGVSAKSALCQAREIA
jgi:hypothetical protein